MAAPQKKSPAGKSGAVRNRNLEHQNTTASAPSPQLKWNRENPLARWAHGAVRSAIRRGLIEPQACEVCGKDPAEAHHDDHMRPLAIRWLCRLHHRRHHAEERRKAGGA